MLRFITRRVALSALILVLAVSLLFGMIHMLPGDPASVILGPRATPELRAELNERMGLDRPFVVQLGQFLGDVATGDLGEDPFSRRAVADIVFEQLPFREKVAGRLLVSDDTRNLHCNQLPVKLGSKHIARATLGRDQAKAAEERPIEIRQHYPRRRIGRW